MKTRKIFKYRAPIAEKFVTGLPDGAEVLRVEDVDGEFFIWAIVDPEEKNKQWFWFECYKTGQPIDSTVSLKDYVGRFRMFIMQELMLYVFLRSDINRPPRWDVDGYVKKDDGFQVLIQ